MKTSKRGLAALIAHEGIVKSRYKDSVGVWTIGIGHTAAAGGIDPKTFKGQLSVKACFKLLAQDIQRYENGVNKALKGCRVSQPQFDALVSFHYNTGGIHRASFMRHVRAGEFKKAAAGMMAWRKPPEIISRRLAERRLFESGQYPAPTANCYPVKRNWHPDFSKPKRIDLNQALRVSTGAKVGGGIVAGGGAVIAAEPSLWPFVLAGMAVAAVVAFFVLKKRNNEWFTFSFFCWPLPRVWCWPGNFIPSVREKMRGWTTFLEGSMMASFAVTGEIVDAFKADQSFWSGYISEYAWNYVVVAMAVWFMFKRVVTRTPWKQK